MIIFIIWHFMFLYVLCNAIFVSLCTLLYIYYSFIVSCSLIQSKHLFHCFLAQLLNKFSYCLLLLHCFLAEIMSTFMLLFAIIPLSFSLANEYIYVIVFYFVVSTYLLIYQNAEPSQFLFLLIKTGCMFHGLKLRFFSDRRVQEFKSCKVSIVTSHRLNRV